MSYEGGNFYAATGSVKKKLGELTTNNLSLGILTSGNNQKIITSSAINFTDVKFVKIIYDFTSWNRESLNIQFYNGSQVYIHQFLPKAWSAGVETLMSNLTAVIDVSLLSTACFKIYAVNDNGDTAGLKGSFVIKSITTYSV